MTVEYEFCLPEPEFSGNLVLFRKEEVTYLLSTKWHRMKHWILASLMMYELHNAYTQLLYKISFSLRTVALIFVS